MIGKLICWFKGKHLRGKPRNAFQGKPVTENGKRTFFCPRCGRETHYKAKA